MEDKGVKKVTIGDIAAQLGVSKATVSRVEVYHGGVQL